jgi:hypothetical protein
MRLLVVVLVIGSCDRDPVYEDYGHDVVRAPMTTIGDVVEHVADHVGRTTRLAGEVERMLGPDALVLVDDGLFETERILVLTQTPAAPLGITLKEGDQAIALGTVRSASVAEVERELGRDLEPHVVIALGTGPVLVAKQVGRVTDGEVEWTDRVQAR